jgi:kumamolisin
MNLDMTGGMMASAGRSRIGGSNREFALEHKHVGAVDEQEKATITLYLRGRGSLDWIAEQEGRPVAEQRRLSREKWAEEHGADPADIAAVRSFASEHDLAVQEESPARRMVRLTGTLAAIASAFGVEELARFELPDGTTYRARRGELSVPSALDGIIVGVFGIDNRPQAKPHIRMRPRATEESGGEGYSPIEVGEAYKFPNGLDGQGQTVAIIELGGGYRMEELESYFSERLAGYLQENSASPPSVTEVSVDGGANTPGSQADGEVMLDIEVVGTLAPAAKIVVYFAPNSGDQGFIDAVSQAVHDATNKPSVVSISWGGPEDQWTEQGRNQMEQVLTEAAALGVTVTVAAGDNGSTDGVTENPQRQHVDFPASAPHALACGGTSLVISEGKETVWNAEPGEGATGGGVSIEFPTRPSYQEPYVTEDNYDTKKPGRGVPDVAGDAARLTGYAILVDGQTQLVGGTSAVAPLWAALIARINQSLGKPVGFLQPQIYPLQEAAFRTITEGNNGAYKAELKGWNACAGLGTPNGTALLAALKSSPPAN